MIDFLRVLRKSPRGGWAKFISVTTVYIRLNSSDFYPVGRLRTIDYFWLVGAEAPMGPCR